MSAPAQPGMIGSLSKLPLMVGVRDDMRVVVDAIGAGGNAAVLVAGCRQSLENPPAKAGSAASGMPQGPCTPPDWLPHGNQGRAVISPGPSKRMDANPKPDSELITRLQQLLWADAATRRLLQEHGLHLTPANFYSTVPGIAELDAIAARGVAHPFLDPGVFREVGLQRGMREVEPHAGELHAPHDDDPDAPAGFFWNNGQFGYSDAVAYYGFLRSRRPRTVLEVGSGFSTLLASAAIEANGEGRIVCIEPYPRPFLEDIGHVEEVVRKPIQQIEAEWINDLLQDGDVLFIDSTHTVKIGSDCVHLFLRLLPALRRKLLIHVHDIYLPDEMPLHWARDMHVYWTEQYLLMAYLLDNPKIEVVWGSHHLARTHRQRMESMLPPGIPAGGGSFWFDRNP